MQNMMRVIDYNSEDHIILPINDGFFREQLQSLKEADKLLP